jgi:hypothetical protein
VGCIAGALGEQEFHALLREPGFEGIEIEPTRIYEFEDARAFLAGAGLETEALARQVGGAVMGAFVRATKPAAKAAPVEDPGATRPCCGSECCA